MNNLPKHHGPGTPEAWGRSCTGLRPALAGCQKLWLFPRGNTIGVIEDRCKAHFDVEHLIRFLSKPFALTTLGRTFAQPAIRYSVASRTYVNFQAFNLIF